MDIGIIKGTFSLKGEHHEFVETASRHDRYESTPISLGRDGGGRGNRGGSQNPPRKSSGGRHPADSEDEVLSKCFLPVFPGRKHSRHPLLVQWVWGVRGL